MNDEERRAAMLRVLEDGMDENKWIKAIAVQSALAIAIIGLTDAIGKGDESVSLTSK